MKKLKYLIAIIVICIVVFIGIEVFRKVEYEEEHTMTNNTTENIDVTTGADVQNTETENTTQEANATSRDTGEAEEIENGEELMQKAEKILTARGWAGASNNVIGLKDGIIYYYNKGTNEFYKIAEGIEDIYYKEDYSEEITVKKNSNFNENKEAPEFLIYE